MDERGKDKERVWRLRETVMDANGPYIHASNLGCVFTFLDLQASKYCELNWSFSLFS